MSVSLEQVKKARAVIEKTIWDIKIFNAASDKWLEINRNSVGSYKIDKILWGWFPEKRIIEIYWENSSWKTTTCLIAAAAYTKQKKYVLVVDAEQSISLDYWLKLWIDPEYLDIFQPDYGEQAFMAIQWAIESWVYDLIIVDSVAALTPKILVENTAEDTQKIWALATLMAQNMPRVQLALAKWKASVIFINQTRAKISLGFSGWYGPQTTTTWGNTLGFFSSIRLEVKKWMPIKRWDELIWMVTKLTTVKNKTYPPKKTCEINLMFDEKWNQWWTDSWTEVFDEIVEKDLIGSKWRYVSLTWEAIKKEKVDNASEIEYLQSFIEENGIDKLEELKWVDFLRIYLKSNPEQFKYLENKIRNWDFSPVIRLEQWNVEWFPFAGSEEELSKAEKRKKRKEAKEVSE